MALTHEQREKVMRLRDIGALAEHETARLLRGIPIIMDMDEGQLRPASRHRSQAARRKAAARRVTR